MGGSSRVTLASLMTKVSCTYATEVSEAFSFRLANIQRFCCNPVKDIIIRGGENIVSITKIA